MDRSHPPLGVKFRPLAVAWNLASLGVILFASACSTNPPVEESMRDGKTTFADVQPILERNCVHCHGESRLPGMPPMADTSAIAKQIGPGKPIVSGKPEKSRFLTVVTLADNQMGAMPPTGHAISKGDAQILRAWIQAGAPLPGENVVLSAQGQSPRSR